MTPQHLSVGAGVLLAAAAPAIPSTVLFLAGCYGIGAIAGQLLALALGARRPSVKGQPPGRCVRARRPPDRATDPGARSLIMRTVRAFLLSLALAALLTLVTFPLLAPLELSPGGRSSLWPSSP